MHPSKLRTTVMLLVLAILWVPSLQATKVLHMDLPEMCDRADKIFRGTVRQVTPGTVQVGGGELPTLTYLVEVTEAFKGEYETIKDVQFATITMINPPKQVQAGGYEAHSVLPSMPQLQVGSEYLLLTTPPSTVGLSTTIGLGQGCFAISEQNKVEMAVNEVNNAGLYDGPVAYSVIAGQIQSALP